MKFVKIIGITFVLLVIGALVILPSNLDVQVEREIDVPVETVYEQVLMLPNWIEWSPWDLSDSTRLHDFKQGHFESNIGGSLEWSTLLPNSSDGRYEVVDARRNEFIIIDVYIYKASKEEKSYRFKFEFEALGEVGATSTKIKWSMTDTAGFMKIQERIQIPGLVDQFTKQFEEGLDNLEKFSKEMDLVMLFPRLDLQPNNMSHFLYYEIEGEAKREEIEKNYTTYARKVFDYTFQQKLKFREPPLIKIPLWDTENNKSRIQFGFAISAEQKDQIEDSLPEGMKIDDIASPILISAELVMPEMPVSEYYKKLNEYIKLKNFTIVGDRMERYMSNPDEPNMPVHIIIMYPLISNEQ